MRLAILSDIHGNPIALDAVLADIQAAGGVDGYWILGDFAALGYDPVGVLERVSALPNAVVLRGNTDHYVVTDTLPPPTIEHARAAPDLIPKLVEVVRSFAWTRGYVTAHGWFEWLAALPVEHRRTLPNGTQALAVHASPGMFDGPGMNPAMDEAELESRFGDCDAALVFVGHVHYPQDRRINHARLVNVGSVSNPVAPDLRASYVLLEADESGYTLDFRRVDYDRRAVLAALDRSRHPASDYLRAFFEGRFRPDWLPDLERRSPRA